MQVTELESKGLHKKFKITVDAKRIGEQTEEELKVVGERIKIPGFRPGMVPMKVLRQRYSTKVQADVIKSLINKTTTELLTEKKLRAALTPQVNIEDYKAGGDLIFTVAMDVFPDVPEMDFGKITLDRKTFEVDEKEIDDTMQRIAENSPTLDRAAEGAKAAKGQVVTIDFAGSIDGVAFDGGTASNFKLELGSGQFIEGFEDQLVGAKEGEARTVKVTFPKDYQAKNLAGKPAEFAVTVKEIHSRKPAEINDAFAQNHGFTDVAAFREAVKSQVAKEYDQLVRNQLKKQLFDYLEENAKFDLPQSMVDLEFNTIWNRLQQSNEMGGDDSGKSEAEQKEEYLNIARRRVKLGLVLAEVGNRNKIQINREELMRAVIQQASMFPGQERKIMEFYREHPDRVDELRGPILEEKSVDFILDKVKFKDKKVSLDELRGSDDEEADAPKKKTASKKKPGGNKE